MRNSTVQQSGEYGGRYESSTTARTGDWTEIQIVTDAIFSLITSNITSLPTAVTFSEGTRINGVFTAFTLTSGSVIAYNRKHQG